jgi:plasmid stability protein
MATLTIRNLPDDIRDRIRREAAEHGRSMESEVRLTLTEHYQRKRSPEEIEKLLADLRANIPPMPTHAKMDLTEAFLAGKRIDLLFEEGAITLPEKRGWDERIDRYDVSLPEVQAFFEEKWPWKPKS